MRALTTLTLSIGLLGSALAAGDYYVSGRTGSDLPGHGTSPTRPWKTIGYALSQIPRPAHPSYHTLHVAGGQTYSPATNGEVFPLRAAFNVSVVGTGTRPVLEVPARQIGVALDAGETFHSVVRFANLVLRGGSVGVRLGGLGADHRPEFVDSAFDGQGGDGVEIAPAGFAVDMPRFVRCAFTGAQRGVFVRIWGSFTTQAVVVAEIDDCSFTDHGGAGVLIDHGHDGPTVTGVAVRIAGARFERCGHGVQVVGETLSAGNRTQVTVQRSAFRDCTAAGVGMLGAMGGKIDNLTIEECSFVGAADAAVRVLDGGPSSACIVRGNYVRGARTGLSFEGSLALATGMPRVVVEDNLVTGCDLGLWIGVSLRSFRIDARRNRLLDDRIGVRIAGPVPAGSAVHLESTVIAGGAGDGLSLDTAATVTGRGLTVADHGGAGLRAVALGTGSAFDHCVFSRNTPEVAGAAAITWSAFETQTVAGTGNLRVDPRLRRPDYKLSPDSPCVDAGTVLLPLPAADYEGDPRLIAGPRGNYPDLGADEWTPAGTARGFGVAGFGSAGMRPRIVAASAPVRLGGVLRVDLADAIDDLDRPASAAVLIAGASDRHLADLHHLGAPGCFAWTDARVVLPPVAVGATGQASLPIRLPLAPSLRGEVLALQWLVVAPSANTAGLVTTGGLRATLGAR